MEELGTRQAPPPAGYQRLIAAAFGSVSAAIFGPDDAPALRRSAPIMLDGGGDDNTLELVERIRRSDLDRAALDTLSITVERLCSEYPYMPLADLRRESRWSCRLRT